MIVGTTILRLDGNPYYSPEFSRGGLAATFVVELLNVALTVSETVTITIEHRNHDDTTWSTASTIPTISAVGNYPKDVTGLKEVIRMKFTFSSTTAADAIHFLIQAPSWRPYA